MYQKNEYFPRQASQTQENLEPKRRHDVQFLQEACLAMQDAELGVLMAYCHAVAQQGEGAANDDAFRAMTARL